MNVVEEFDIWQSKTGRTKSVILDDDARASVKKWIDISEKTSGDFLWTSLKRQKGAPKPLSRMQFSRLVKDWAMMVSRNPRRYSTHSMRRTKSSLIYRKTKNLRVCQHLLGHKSIGATAEYLGIDRREALDIAREFTF